VNKDTFRIHLCEQVILSTSSSRQFSLRPVFRDLRTVRVALSLREQARRVRAAPPRDRDIIVESPGSDASADASKPHTGTAVGRCTRVHILSAATGPKPNMRSAGLPTSQGSANQWSPKDFWECRCIQGGVRVESIVRGGGSAPMNFLSSYI
jgi:hypothetical protein